MFAHNTPLKVIDSHTGGEPTRIIVEGGPDLGQGSMAERLDKLRTHHDHLRTALLCEPRGSEVMVGALLCPAHDPANHAGVIFFNNVGYLGMCGHGTIGLAATLAHMGVMSPGDHRIETPVGEVQVTLHSANKVSIANVLSYRYRKDVAVNVDGYGLVKGDIAWGGNWFFLVSQHGQQLTKSNSDALTAFASRVREALERDNIRAKDGEEIDHIELFSPPPDNSSSDSRNFVLCPGHVYDRSPCGTGTSAKLACLYAEGTLKVGQTWRQESIIGSIFEGRIAVAKDDQVLPIITGEAYVNAELNLICHPSDPFAWGINAKSPLSQ